MMGMRGQHCDQHDGHGLQKHPAHRRDHFGVGGDGDDAPAARPIRSVPRQFGVSDHERYVAVLDHHPSGMVLLHLPVQGGVRGDDRLQARAVIFCGTQQHMTPHIDHVSLLLADSMPVRVPQHLLERCIQELGYQNAARAALQVADPGQQPEGRTIGARFTVDLRHFDGTHGIGVKRPILR